MTLSEYTKIKQLIELHVGKCEGHYHLLEHLKDVFKKHINSPRRMETIKSITGLLSVLEIRGVLSEDDITPLKEIAMNLTNNTEVLKKIQQYEQSYVPSEAVNRFGSKEPIGIVDNSKNIHVNIYSPSYLSEEKENRINKTLIAEIGTFWRDIGRNLQVRECRINDIDKHCQTSSEKTSKIIEEYNAIADPQRWFLVLCNALEKSRRKDLSVKLQEIMAMNI